ncbi:MAG: glycosyl transferase [Actinobacteria bacterium]|nr:glycosyl transferase [Actinomycetota bacterium]MCG2819925.1 glycosyl transferase [Actinomycetes bacterium]MBU4218986.1 glycosyl transferase [Actinomycetota bacterium]MBU4359174.1 glycosyl transferase [Actinomycetota bacterium]MBU4391489.1 glycosyl transferase [Actinomycetota bacterium]
MLVAAGAFLGSIAAGVLILVGCGGIMEDGPRVTNYAGSSVPAAAGFLFVPVYLLTYVVIRAVEGFPEKQAFGPAESLLVLVLGMCFLGLMDDVFGDGKASGFKGHIRALFKGRISTGFLKALGGLLVALAVSLPLSHNWWELFLNATLIALCANLFNLLDMRPGRALKVFLPALAGVVALNWKLMDTFVPYLLSVGAVALVLLPGDLSERFMLGDAGSNVLGATVGLGVAIGAGNWWKLGVLLFLVFMNILSEKYSFSKAVDSNRPLNWMDRLGRKGEKPGETEYK